MTFNLGLGDIVAILTICGVLGGLGVNYVLSKARNEFAGKSGLDELSEDVRRVDQHLAGTVSHKDMGEMFGRLGQLEQKAAVSQEAIANVRESTRRIESAVTRLVDAQLEREAQATGRKRQGVAP